MLTIKQLAIALSYANLNDVCLETGISLEVLQKIKRESNTVPYSAIKKLSEYYGEECED